MERDFLDEIMEMGTKKNPRFPDMVAEAIARRKAARLLAQRREKTGLSQTMVAAWMGTSASVVSKLESGADVRLSTLMRYCAAIGEKQTPSLRVESRATSRSRRRQPRPAQDRRGKTVNARLAKLAAAGDITLPTRKGFMKIRPSRIRGKSISSTILEDRE